MSCVSVLLTYLLGGTISILEFVISAVGGLLFLGVGVKALVLTPIMVGVGVISTVVGVIFMVDLGMALKNTSFTVTATRTTK